MINLKRLYILQWPKYETFISFNHKTIRQEMLTRMVYAGISTSEIEDRHDIHQIVKLLKKHVDVSLTTQRDYSTLIGSASASLLDAQNPCVLTNIIKQVNAWITYDTQADTELAFCQRLLGVSGISQLKAYFENLYSESIEDSTHASAIEQIISQKLEDLYYSASLLAYLNEYYEIMCEEGDETEMDEYQTDLKATYIKRLSVTDHHFDILMNLTTFRAAIHFLENKD